MRNFNTFLFPLANLANSPQEKPDEQINHGGTARALGVAMSGISLYNTEPAKFHQRTLNYIRDTRYKYCGLNSHNAIIWPRDLQKMVVISDISPMVLHLTVDSFLKMARETYQILRERNITEGRYGPRNTPNSSSVGPNQANMLFSHGQNCRTFVSYDRFDSVPRYPKGRDIYSII